MDGVSVRNGYYIVAVRQRGGRFDGALFLSDGRQHATAADAASVGAELSIATK